jgi:hypothetical protein
MLTRNLPAAHEIMIKRTALLAALIVSGSFASAARAQGTTEAGRLGYFVGYQEAIFELNNGKAFCVSASSLAAVPDVIRKSSSTIDANKPARGVTSALARAFPCEGQDFKPSVFSSNDIARALLQVEITDQIASDEQFSQSHSVGMIVAVSDLGEGESFCMAGSKNKMSDVLQAHQQKHPTEPFSATFVAEAYKAGYPCEGGFLP